MGKTDFLSRKEGTSVGRKASQPIAWVMVSELAAMLRVSQSTLYKMLRDGRLPVPSKVGGKKKWYRSEIEEWERMGRPSAQEFDADIERRQLKMMRQLTPILGREKFTGAKIQKKY
jgi:excisionase family DNA binding protein